MKKVIHTRRRFFNLVACDKTDEFFGKYLSKGTKILVEGRIQNNNYTDDKGVNHYAQDIIVENVESAEAKKIAQKKTRRQTLPVNLLITTMIYHFSIKTASGTKIETSYKKSR